MDRADARAREHTNRGFRYHREVDRDPIAPLHAEILEQCRRSTYFPMQLAIGDPPHLTRIVSLPHDRDLLSSMKKMAVETVLTYVELSSNEPLNVRLREVPRDDLAPQRVPLNQRTSLLVPKLFRMLNGELIELVIGVGGNVGGSGDADRHREAGIGGHTRNSKGHSLRPAYDSPRHCSGELKKFPPPAV